MIMKVAKDIIKLANIVSDETVGNKEIMAHPGPVVKTENITAKE